MNARHVAFGADGLEMSGELVAGPGARAIVVLCHGIPGERAAGDSGYAGLAATVAARGFATFWFDFRGARSAPGDFSIGGWVRDLGAAVDALRADRVVGSLPVVAVGSSAGGAVCVAAAAERDDIAAVATLAAPASFSFAGDAADRVLARLRNAGLIRDPAFPRDPQAWWSELESFAAERLAGRVSPRPLLVAHGEADEVVPYSHAERLFGAASAPKELARIPGAGHQLRRDPRGVACLLDWLERLPLRA